MSTTRRRIGLPLFEKHSLSEAPSINSFQLIRWLWQHSKPEVLWMGLSMLGVAAGSSISAFSLLYLKKFLNKIEQGYTIPELLKIFALIIGISLGFSVVKWLTTTLGALASTRVRRNLEIACFQHLSSLPYEYLEGKSSGRLTAVLMAELPIVSGMIGIILRSFIHAPFTILVVVAVLWYNSPVVALALIICLPLLFIGLKSFSSMAKKASSHAFEGISSMYTKMYEHLSGIRVVRCMGLIDWYAAAMKELSQKVARKSQRAAIIGAFQQSAQEIIALLVLIAFLFWISWRVLAGTMQIGQALLVPVIILLIRNEVLKISSGVVRLRKTEGAATRLRELLHTRREIFGTQTLTKPLNVIRFVDVTFHYPNGTSVLEHVDLELQPGGLTVIVGESGTGKSTLCDLCLRLRLPTDGEIFYNHVESKQLDEDFLHSCTALVEQEPYLFEGTVKYNLLLSATSISDNEIWQTLRLTNADDFVKALPEGLNSDVGQNGVNLSVGQKQRIVLARALLRNPRFLVLDEFTSSLDSDNEAEILRTILQLSQHAIVLCTTHRPSILKHAREIYRIAHKKLYRISTYEV